jgi:cysteine desulfurase/selenocysteine lyase
MDSIEKRVLGLSEYLIEGLKDLGLKINTPIEREMRAGIVTYTNDRYEDNAVSYEAMKKEGVMVAHRYTGGVGGVRISPHFFNTEEEIDRALNVQKKML